jgi:hypothetical protein
MPCTKEVRLVDVAIRTLIEAIIASHEARRQTRRATNGCHPGEQRHARVTP